MSKLPDEVYWRYKKKVPPKEEFPDMNGPVKTKLPHPFKCSKCTYIAQDKRDFNDHWSLEH